MLINVIEAPVILSPPETLKPGVFLQNKSFLLIPVSFGLVSDNPLTDKDKIIPNHSSFYRPFQSFIRVCLWWRNGFHRLQRNLETFWDICNIFPRQLFNIYDYNSPYSSPGRGFQIRHLNLQKVLTTNYYFAK